MLKEFLSFRGLILGVLTVLTVSSASRVVAQSDTASITGQVLDNTGASVVAAEVDAINLDTNFTYHATSSTNGEWTISPVHIGSYRLVVVAPGFKKQEVTSFTLSVQQRQRLDVTLQPGALSQTVEVTTAAPLLESENSERGQLIDGRTLETLALNGRNPVQLAQLTAGVTISEPGARDESSYGFSANGARSLQNNFLLDGIDNNSNLPDLLNEANYVISPSVDALQEFRVETGSYGAELGRATGAVVNATIKSGSNQFHGVVYEFLRNQAFDARNFYDAKLPPYRQNQFGGTLGGPILHDKLFFFVDYEGLRVSQGETSTALVPTPAQRGGDFSSQLNLTSPTGFDCNGNRTYAGELFDVTQTQASAGVSGYCSVPFAYGAGGVPSNVIPTAKIDPLGAKLAALFPLPNATNPGYNFVSNPLLTRHRDQGDIRVDQVIGKNDNAFYRFSMSRAPANRPGPFPDLADGGGFFTGIEQDNGYSVAASETHIFSPKRVNELRLGYNRLRASRVPFNSGQDISGQIGFPGVPYVAGTNSGGLPQLTFSDVATLGSPTYLPSLEIQNTYSVSDTFTLILGNHNIKIGGELRPEEFTILQPAAPRGLLNFSTQFTDNPAAQGSGGSGLASLLVGHPNSGTINSITNIDYFKTVYAAFLQDDWRATPRLTFNLGVRYEYFSPVRERHNRQANFNSVTGLLDIPRSSNVTLTPTLAGILTVNHTAGDRLLTSHPAEFAPRLGLAYQISKRMVFRSAFGVFFNGDEAGPYSNPSPGFNPPFVSSQNFNTVCGLSGASPAINCAIPDLQQLSSGFPSNSLSDPNTPNLFAFDPKLTIPYVMQWHANLQYELGHNTLLDIAFVGSKGTKLYTDFNLNQATPTPDAAAPYAARRPFPRIDSAIYGINSEGYSFYDGLQMKVERRFASGVSALVNYTYSHALGDFSTTLGSQSNVGFRYSRAPQIEYGPLDFDTRHRFVVSYTLQLPFGRNRQFASNTNALVNAVIGNWETSSVAVLSTGNFFTVTDVSANYANSDGQQRPDAVAGQKPNGKPCVKGTYFNTCAFVSAQPGSYGSVGLNTLRGPGSINWDTSLLKSFPFGEKRRVEFRAEFYNVINHTNSLFATPGPQNGNSATVLGTSNFGFLSAARPPRQIQLGLKLYY